MAQSGYTPLQLYYSTTSSQVPVNTNLQFGELAINITDGKLYYKDNTGTVQLLADKAAAAGVTTISFGSTGLTPSSPTSGAVSVAGTLGAGYGGTGYNSYAAGDLLYASGTTSFGKLTLGTTNYVLTAGALAPQWSQYVGVANGGTAIGSYAIGDLLVASGTTTLSKLAIGANNYVLTSNGTTATWAAVPSSMVYPGAGIPNSTGSAWGTSYSTTGSGTVVALATSPSFTTPTLGVASATTINKVTLTTPATGSTLTILDGKTLTANNSITLAGTDSTTMTFPSTSATLGGLGIAQSWTAKNTFNLVVDAVNTVTVTSNAGTVPVTFKLNNFTNSSAATMTITMATASAVDGQMSIVRIYDFSAVAQTISWVNTEDSNVTAPTTSNGSTTLPLTVGFMYNGSTSKWRCIASA